MSDFELQRTPRDTTMSDTGTTTTPRESEFPGTQAAPTVEELRRQQAALSGQPVQMQQTSPTFTQAELDAERERVRNEERAKLMPQLAAVDQIKAEMDALKAERAAEQAEKQRLIDEANQAAETERLEKLTLTQRLEHHTRETDERFRRMEEERQLEQTVFQREREYAAQAEYRAQKLAMVADQIMPQFRDLVAVGSQEEVDRSIDDMIARTNAAMADVQQAQQQQWAAQRGVSPTGIPASGPLENLPGQTQDWTPQQIAAMSPAEYARNRPTLLQAASRHVNSRR